MGIPDHVRQGTELVETFHPVCLCWLGSCYVDSLEKSLTQLTGMIISSDISFIVKIKDNRKETSNQNEYPISRSDETGAGAENLRSVARHLPGSRSAVARPTSPDIR